MLRCQSSRDSDLLRGRMRWSSSAFAAAAAGVEGEDICLGSIGCVMRDAALLGELR